MVYKCLYWYVVVKIFRWKLWVNFDNRLFNILFINNCLKIWWLIYLLIEIKEGDKKFNLEVK